MMNRQQLLYSFGLIFLILILACDDEPTQPSSSGIESKLTSFTDCKSFKDNNATDSVSTGQSCIEFDYVDSILYLTHINAGFNCCPGIITADFTIEGNTITISEHESMSECNCDCLYDLDLQIANLPIGTYHFIFIEPYAMEPGHEIAFTINLTDSVTGIYCVNRNHYPWSGGTKMISVSDCKNMKSSLVADNQSFIDYNFEGGMLYVDHINAGFNCCPGIISTDINIVGNTITITESESAQDCFCECLYDIALQISGLQVGVYQFIFEEPYASQPGQEIEFTINLNDSISGNYCVQRDFYPWGIP